MPNKRHRTFSKGKGPATGHSGPRNDEVSPEKTKKWPDVPGGTQPKTRNHGMKHMKQGVASKGV